MGCSIHPTQPSEDELKNSSKKRYKRYVEDVFRRQNQAMSQIILLPVDSLSSDIQRELLNAEQAVTKRCKVLNDIASLHSEGKKESMMQKLKVSRSVKDCENATRDLELIMERAQMELSNHDDI